MQSEINYQMNLYNNKRIVNLKDVKRQPNQYQKTGKSIANLKLNTRESLIPQKKCLMDTNRPPIRGRLHNFLYFLFYNIFNDCDVTNLTS